MRPPIFDAKILRQYLQRHKIATLTDLKRVLDTDVDITVFRKLKRLDYRTRYTHRGSYYTLKEVAHFDDSGLWSHQAVWFSRYGTLLLTVEHFVILSIIRHGASSPVISLTSSTQKFMTPCISWSSKSVYNEPRSTACTSIPLSIHPPTVGSCARNEPRNPFPS